MDEQKRLFSEVEKLEAKKGDVILIKPATIDDANLPTLQMLGKSLSKMFECLVILVGTNDSIETLDESEMASYGWVRKTET